MCGFVVDGVARFRSIDRDDHDTIAHFGLNKLGHKPSAKDSGNSVRSPKPHDAQPLIIRPIHEPSERAYSVLRAEPVKINGFKKDFANSGPYTCQLFSTLF